MKNLIYSFYIYFLSQLFLQLNCQFENFIYGSFKTIQTNQYAYNIQFLPSNENIIIVGDNGQVSFYDKDQYYKVIRTIETRDYAWTVQFNPDNTVMAVGDSDSAKFYNLTDYSLIMTIPTNFYPRAIKYCPTSQFVAIGDYGSIRFYNLTDKYALIKTIPTNEFVFSIDYNHNGSMVAIGENLRSSIFNVTDNYTLINSITTNGYVFSVDFNVNGTILGVSENGFAKFYNTETWGDPIKTIPANGYVFSIKFKDIDSSWVAIGQSNEAVIYHVRTWNVYKRFKTIGQVVTINYSQNNSVVALGSLGKAQLFCILDDNTCDCGEYAYKQFNATTSFYNCVECGLDEQVGLDIFENKVCKPCGIGSIKQDFKCFACDDFSIKNQETLTCIKCGANSIKIGIYCTECDDNSIQNGTTCEECPVNSFKNLETQQCLRCANDEILQNKTCIKCGENAIRNVQRQTCDECEPYQFKYTDTRRIGEQYCITCNLISVDECTECNSNSIFVNYTCFECNDTSIAIKTNQTCQQCQSGYYKNGVQCLKEITLTAIVIIMPTIYLMIVLISIWI